MYEKILLGLSGSPYPDTRNSQLLTALVDFLPVGWRMKPSIRLDHLPVFQPQLDKAPWPEEVVQLRRELAEAAAIVISTPEYLQTLPAVLKNALEWLTSSGELQAKRVLPITFTPHAPRGEGAMQALLASLQALEARPIVAMPLYQQAQNWEEGQLKFHRDTAEMLQEGIALLVSE